MLLISLAGADLVSLRVELGRKTMSPLKKFGILKGLPLALYYLACFSTYRNPTGFGFVRIPSDTHL
jgi:hypothetical protein